MYVQADGFVVTCRTLISMMLSDWEWEVSSPVELSHRAVRGMKWRCLAPPHFGVRQHSCSVWDTWGTVGAVAAIISFQDSGCWWLMCFH